MVARIRDLSEKDSKARSRDNRRVARVVWLTWLVWLFVITEADELLRSKSDAKRAFSFSKIHHSAAMPSKGKYSKGTIAWHEFRLLKPKQIGTGDEKQRSVS